MSTIISAQNNFVYVHIPKCAGMSISLGLQSALADTSETDIWLEGEIIEHPVIGSIMPAHKPLQMLAEHFPNELRTYQESECFAVVRDPWQRFPSAVQQYLREFRRVRMEEMSSAELDKEVMNIISVMEERPIYPGVDYVHFLRQRDFLFLGNKKIIDHVYGIEQITKMSEHMSRVLNRRVDLADRVNTSAPPVGILYKSLAKIGRSAKKGIPLSSYKAIKRYIRKTFTPKQVELPDVFKATHVVDFVKGFYADDIEIYRDARFSATSY